MPAWSVGGWSSAIPIAQANRHVAVSDGTAAAPAYSWAANLNMGFYRIAANQMGFSATGVAQIVFTGSTTAFIAAMLLNWSATSDPAGASDLGLARNAAGVLEINSGTAGTLRDLVARGVTANGATQGVGYATGAGGTVTQLTNKSTGVTLNTATGQITMNAAALAASTTVSFTLTNSAIAATDILLLNHISAGTAGAYTLNAQAAAGSASVNVRNVSLGSLSEAIVIAYAIIKGVTA